MGGLVLESVSHTTGKLGRLHWLVPYLHVFVDHEGLARQHHPALLPGRLLISREYKELLTVVQDFRIIPLQLLQTNDDLTRPLSSRTLR